MWEEGGYGTKILCYLYQTEESIEDERENATKHLKRSAERSFVEDMLVDSTVLVKGVHCSSLGSSIPPSPFLRSGYCEDLGGTRFARNSSCPIFEEKISRKDEYSQKYLRYRFQRKCLLVK
ncbi:hypothetical protein CDAR_505751 [Caerostris darwini]|uniref:Uncharacterized protein n=1 Tax=Caerostris darwini TaxID=1538125 RepID=A0AAV4WAQ4_9ARAC|nr:hypothetical protein CDAR_505751 [Caerostris darwini]